jgi:hypothetical protein
VNILYRVLKTKRRNLTIQKLNISFRMATGIRIGPTCKAIQCPRIIGNVVGTRLTYEAQRNSVLWFTFLRAHCWVNNHVHHYHRPHFDKQTNYMKLIHLLFGFSLQALHEQITQTNKRTDRQVTDPEIREIHHSLRSQICVCLKSRHYVLSANTPGFAQTGVLPLTLDSNNCHKVTLEQICVTSKIRHKYVD